jgi:hypothetical protein
MDARKNGVYDDIFRAVQSALWGGVDAAEFQKMLRTAWDEALSEKRRTDMAALSAHLP